MAESSTIGASFSQYQGDPNLGGGGLGFGRIDTRPIQDLARYVFLYNKSEYDQRQKDAEDAAKEISDYMNYDLNTSIPKDRKIIEDKYQKLLSYVRENPDAINYRNKEKWTEYQKLRHDLANDITNGKVRSALNINREKEISDEKNEERKKIMREQLDKDIERTGIRDSLPVTQQYDLTVPELGINKGMKFDVAKAGSNQIFKRDYVMFDRAEAMRAGAAVEFGIDAIDLGTETGIRKQAGLKQNFWVRGKDLFNQAIQSTKKEDGTLDESKISGLALSLLNQVKKYNADTEKERINIDRGIYRDKVGNVVDFGSGNFRPEHFQPINFQDGISAQELAVVAQYAAWPGDDYETKVIQTDDEIQRGNLAARWAEVGIQRERLDMAKQDDLLGADAVWGEFSDLIRQGRPVAIRNWTTEGGTVTKDQQRNVVEIADPNLLKTFSTIDKEGKTTNVPNAILFDAQRNQANLVYYKTKANDEGVISIVKDSKGNPVVDNQISINPTQILGEITRRKFPNKDIGGINTQLERAYNYYDRNAKKFADNYRVGTTEQTKSKYKLGGKTYSFEQVQKAAQQSGMSVQEYIKTAGLQ